MSVSHAVKLKAAIVYLPGIKLLFTDHELTNKNKRRIGKKNVCVFKSVLWIRTMERLNSIIMNVLVKWNIFCKRLELDDSKFAKKENIARFYFKLMRNSQKWVAKCCFCMSHIVFGSPKQICIMSNMISDNTQPYRLTMIMMLPCAV